MLLSVDICMILKIYRNMLLFQNQHIYKQQQKNQYKDIKQFIPAEVEVRITPPKRAILKPNRFSFLDEEEENGQ